MGCWTRGRLCVRLENDGTVLLFVCGNTVADQDIDLAVGGAPLVIGYTMQLVEQPLVIGHDVQFIQHSVINADRKTFDSHKITP